jgi:hypothetical protein
MSIYSEPVIVYSTLLINLNIRYVNLKEPRRSMCAGPEAGSPPGSYHEL